MEWALEGALACVNSQVVVEIMELPEVHLAVLEVALQNRPVPVSLWIPVFENSKVA